MRVSVEAYGCTLNRGESEIMEGLLENSGHEIVSTEEAEASLIVTCCVIESTERRMLKRIRELKERNKKILVGGCMATVMKDKVASVDPEAVFISPRSLEDVLKHVGIEEEGSAKDITEKAPPSTSIDAIVPIGQGCTEECSYCITRLARGFLESYPLDDIVDAAAGRLSHGYGEIRLTSQDTAAYGRDIGISLPELMRRVASLDGEFRIRVGMANITNLLPILDEAIGAFASSRIYKFLHVPVQSGDDDILKRMRRRYSTQDFIRICDSFRQAFPDLTISTDIITGFPGETEEQFQASFDLMKKVHPDIINITRFSAREGTEAFDMDQQVPGWESKERSRKLTKLRTDLSVERNRTLVGSVFDVMTTERVKRGTTMGRTQSYRPVVLPGEIPLGEFHRVRIQSATESYLLGDLIEEE